MHLLVCLFEQQHAVPKKLILKRCLSQIIKLLLKLLSHPAQTGCGGYHQVFIA